MLILTYYETPYPAINGCLPAGPGKGLWPNGIAIA